MRGPSVDVPPARGRAPRPPAPQFHVAEHVLAGHPDRLADALAEALVDAAVAHDSDALVGVEVGVHRDTVFVTGRVAAGRPHDPVDLHLGALARDVYRAAGYEGRWRIVPRVRADLDVGALADDERAIRGYSDDQSIVVGYACGGPRTGFLPPAPWAARELAHALAAARRAAPGVLGPDGKVLAGIEEHEGRYRWRVLNASIQHGEGVQPDAVHALIQPALRGASRRMAAALPGLHASWDERLPRINGAGDFSCGGPHSDNGLSGKKLVVDHYGPGVPIGGGALCGKDPHKVDRQGALRARELAISLLLATGAHEAQTTLVYLPGLERPAHVTALLDGRPVDAARIARITPLPDLSITGTVRDLELTSTRWTERLAEARTLWSPRHASAAAAPAASAPTPRRC